MSKLTICSVSFYSSRFLRLNRSLCERLNNNSQLSRWLVVENTPVDGRDPKLYSDFDFTLIDGVEPPDVPTKFRASYHHGAALNKAVQHVDSTYILIMDPDFYLIGQDWIRNVLKYMEKKDLAFFGAPWHPRLYRKYRYFPSVHCMFINLEKVDKSTLDFSPDLLNRPTSIKPAFWERFNNIEQKGLWRKKIKVLARSPLRAIKEDLTLRKLIMSSPDTGVRVFRRVRQEKHLNYETVQPVFLPLHDQFLPFCISRFQRNRLIEAVFPESMRYIPRKKKYYTTKGFKYYGFIDTIQLGWDEFFWKRKPFGFHVRSYLNQLRSNGVDWERLKCIIDSFADNF